MNGYIYLKKATLTAMKKLSYIIRGEASLEGDNLVIQWNLCNPTPEYSDILNNMTHPPGPLVCRVRQVLTS